MRIVKIMTLAFVVCALVACGEKKSAKPAEAPAPDTTKKEESKDEGSKSNDADKASGSKDKAKNNKEQTPPVSDEKIKALTGGLDATAAKIHLGFDGKSDFTALVGIGEGLTCTSQDTAVVTVAIKDLQITPELLEAIIADQKKNDKKFNAEDEKDLRDELASKTFKTCQATPVKAGKGAIKVSVSEDGEVFESTRQTVVHQYAAEDVEAGRQRYNGKVTDGPSRSCGTCHLTGKIGAPTHKIGEVSSYTDKTIGEWVVAGRSIFNEGVTDPEETYVPDFKDHKWDFVSEKEVKGMIGYLRSIQSRDPFDIAKYLLVGASQ